MGTWLNDNNGRPELLREPEPLHYSDVMIPNSWFGNGGNYGQYNIVSCHSDGPIDRY